MLVLGHPFEVSETCICETERYAQAWCGPDSIGFVAGVEVPSATLYEALDTHGHEVDLPSLECADCRDAAARSAICRSCGWGFVGNRIYASRLTYYLARGALEAAPRTDCRVCRENATGSGWCERCARGQVGRYRYADRSLFEAAERERRILLRAVTDLERCETCAVARYFGSLCPLCWVTYEHGEPVTP